VPVDRNIAGKAGSKTVKSAIIGVLSAAFLTIGTNALAKEPVPAGSGIVAQERPLGTVFLNAAGMPLYVYDPDKKSGKSTCTEKCATAWPPLMAAPDSQPTGSWTLAAREEGGNQWAFEGNPVYTFAKDTLPGLAVGENAQDIWHIAIKFAPRPRDVIYRGTAVGRIAADIKGMALYSFDGDTADGAGCSAACLQQWKPMQAPGAASAVGDWSVVERKDDGEPQWAYKGKPVYHYAGDVNPGDMAGEGIEGKWHVLIMDPTPSTPKWITVQQSEVGPIFANAKGQTLYTLTADIETIKKVSCDEACLKEHFVVVLAEGHMAAQTVPGSNWGAVRNPQGQMQWTFRGKFLYSFNGDKKPGDINATAFGGNGLGATWAAIPVSSGFLPIL
jgi:predicted lipoprotein with Yx(FWY)xxD motif